jgi:hypothetical protein
MDLPTAADKIVASLEVIKEYFIALRKNEEDANAPNTNKPFEEINNHINILYGLSRSLGVKLEAIDRQIATDRFRELIQYRIDEDSEQAKSEHIDSLFHYFHKRITSLEQIIANQSSTGAQDSQSLSESGANVGLQYKDDAVQDPAGQAAASVLETKGMPDQEITLKESEPHPQGFGENPLSPETSSQTTRRSSQRRNS